MNKGENPILEKPETKNTTEEITMAINLNNFVDISSVSPEQMAVGRAFGGLVFTASDAIDQAAGAESPTGGDLAKLAEDYNAGKPVTLTLDEVGALFGRPIVDYQDGEDDTYPEYVHARGYYSYISPKGNVASSLQFAKILPGQSPVQAFTAIDAMTNNFGSFTFLKFTPVAESDASSNADIDNLLAVARYNQGLQSKYLFVVNRKRGSLPKDQVTSEADQFSGIKGTCFVSGATQASSYMPMAIFASTDYSNGTVVNFMFKQFTGEVPTVTSDAVYTDFNKHCVNFYGRTQSNGQTIDFFQRGFNTDGMDTAIYCNEIWFKAACETRLSDFLFVNERLPASNEGVNLVATEVTVVCNDAVQNQAFTVRPSIVQSEKVMIRQLINQTMDDAAGAAAEAAMAETDLATSGYHVYAYLAGPEQPTGTIANKIGKASEYVIVYYVFYGTAESIRYIKGTNVLVK